MVRTFFGLCIASVSLAARMEVRNRLNTTATDYPLCSEVRSCGTNARCRVQKGCFPKDDCRCADGNGPVLLCFEGRELPLSEVCLEKAKEKAIARALKEEAKRWKREYKWTRGPVAPGQLFMYSKPSNVLNFMIIGDWGGSSDKQPTTGSQIATAQGMGIAGEIFKPSFVLGLGDNFYPVGVHEYNKFRLEASFNSVYTHNSLQVPWYNIAGNHDWAGAGSIDMQIQYTKNNDKWVFPSAHYTFRKSLPSGKTIKFVMFDHLQVAKNKRYAPMSRAEAKDEKLKDVQWEQQPFTNNKQAWTWLEQELANSEDHYLILVDHHPVYTVCSHDFSPRLQGIPELMTKYRVTAFMSGHDHCAMTIAHEGNTFILQGAGAQAWSSGLFTGKVEQMGAKVEYSIHRNNKNGIKGSFSTAEASDSALTIRHHDHNGNVLHQMAPLKPRM